MVFWPPQLSDLNQDFPLEGNAIFRPNFILSGRRYRPKSVHIDTVRDDRQSPIRDAKVLKSSLFEPRRYECDENASLAQFLEDAFLERAFVVRSWDIGVEGAKTVNGEEEWVTIGGQKEVDKSRSFKIVRMNINHIWPVALDC